MSLITDPAVAVTKSTLDQIQPLRSVFLQENNIQIRYDACHACNWSDPYLLQLDERVVGYGAVKGKEQLTDRDAIFEFYVFPAYRRWSAELFQALVAASGARFVECQTNESQLSALLYEFCYHIHSDAMLFADHYTTHYQRSDVRFRRWKPDDPLAGLSRPEPGAYVLERDDEVIAAGGFLTHYNAPFADLYMEVKEGYHNQGYGSYLLQEIKKACLAAGRVPAARCNLSNKASRATLIKAGFRVCGFMLVGEIREEER